MVLAPAVVNKSSVNTIQAKAPLLSMIAQMSLTLIWPTTAQIVLRLTISAYGFRPLKNAASQVASHPCVSQVVMRASKRIAGSGFSEVQFTGSTHFRTY